MQCQVVDILQKLFNWNLKPFKYSLLMLFVFIDCDANGDTYIYIYIPQMELSTHFTCRSPSQHKTYRDLINNFSSSNYQYLSVLPRDSRSLFSHSTTIKTGLLRSTCDQIWMRAQSLNTGELALMERWGNGRGREESVSLGSAVTKLQALRAFSNADLPSSTLSPLH